MVVFGASSGAPGLILARFGSSEPRFWRPKRLFFRVLDNETPPRRKITLIRGLSTNTVVFATSKSSKIDVNFVRRADRASRASRSGSGRVQERPGAPSWRPRWPTWRPSGSKLAPRRVRNPPKNGASHLFVQPRAPNPIFRRFSSKFGRFFVDFRRFCVDFSTIFRRFFRRFCVRSLLFFYCLQDAFFRRFCVRSLLFLHCLRDAICANLDFMASVSVSFGKAV